MYHKGTIFEHSYYDTIEEMPTTAKVYFPDDSNFRKSEVWNS